MLVVGPNGVGRSSLIRATAGLWGKGAGTIHRPPLGEVMFLPQRPYLVPGSLRDQLIYAATQTRITDEEILDVLRLVKYEPVLERVGGLDVEQDWGKTLSLSEQQQLALAGLLLAEPRFAFLDEATSALDPSRAQAIYRALERTNITYVSVANDLNLIEFHDELLELSLNGSWRLAPRRLLATASTRDGLAWRAAGINPAARRSRIPGSFAIITGVTRYFRLWFALGRFGLLREMAFRSNFLVRVAVEVLWFVIMLIFYDAIFTQTAGNAVAGWGRNEYFFFVGCYFALGGLIETLFLEQLQRVRRTGAQRRPRLLPAQADRRAIPDHLPRHRLGDGPERPDGRRPDGLRPGRDADWQFDPLRGARVPGCCSSAAWRWHTASCCC